MGQPYDLGPYISEHYALLSWIVDGITAETYPWGIALEFGVGGGTSTRIIAEKMPVIGFDSFKGLPESWRPGFGEGAFACDQPDLSDCFYPPSLYVGLFEDVLPEFPWDTLSPVRLIHIDCDLYSSTRTVLANLPLDLLHRDKPVICFDEWHGYNDCEEHEQRAWREFVGETNIQWEVVGHSYQQWAIKVA